LVGQTNIPFLFRLLTHEVFVSGQTWTTFIDDTPDLFKLVSSQNRAQKLLSYLGDIAVNGSSILGQSGPPGLTDEAIVPTFYKKDDPKTPIDTSKPCLTGWRNIIVKEGPEAFAKAIRAYKGCVSSSSVSDAVLGLLPLKRRFLVVSLLDSSSWTLHGETPTNRSLLPDSERSTWPTSPERPRTSSRTLTRSSAGVEP
jgi:pyruvate carboxylase